MSKFAWIKTKKEFNEMKEWLDNEIDNVLCLPASPTHNNYYLKLLSDRDDLIELSIKNPHLMETKTESTG